MFRVVIILTVSKVKWEIVSVKKIKSVGMSLVVGMLITMLMADVGIQAWSKTGSIVSF